MTAAERVERLTERVASEKARLDHATKKCSKWARRVEKARRDLNSWERMLRIATSEAEREAALPAEPAEGKVVTFVKQYRGNPILYRFAAVRGGDRWWVTGDAPQTKHGITWKALCDFAQAGNLMLAQQPRPMVDATEAAVQPPF